MKHLAEVVVRELLSATQGAVKQERFYWDVFNDRAAVKEENQGLKAQVSDLEMRLKLAQDDGFKSMENLKAASNEVARLTRALLEAGEAVLNMQTQIEDMKKSKKGRR